MFASPFKDGIIVLVILLLFFGPKRLPALSRSIGESIKEFKGGIAEATSSDAPEIHAAPSTVAPSTTTESPAETKTSA